MLNAMCEGQALHTDPEDEDLGDYDGEEYDVDAHEQGQGDSPMFYSLRRKLITFNSRRPSHVGESRRNAFSACEQPGWSSDRRLSKRL